MSRKRSRKTKGLPTHRQDDSDVENDVEIPQARAIHLSKDRRRVIETQREPQQHFSSTSGEPQSSTYTPFPYAEAPVLDEALEPAVVTPAAKLSAKRYPTSDAPLRKWAGKIDGHDYRQEYVLESLRMEGRGSSESLKSCPTCAAATPAFRCESCFGGVMECQACCVKRHERLPLHQILNWNGTFFEKTSLRALGLKVQLGHVDLRCVNPTPGHTDFTVLDGNGIYQVAVNFCACDERVTRRQQLLRADWWPATVDQPQTCATSRLLEQFHVITLTGKLTAYDYYKSLEHLTDNTNVTVPKPRYKEFMRMVRQFRHVKMMKRAGRGNIPDGVRTTLAGELAIQCIACPIPGVNLPDGWEKAERAFLYLLILALDANFRAKNLFRSTDAADPGLHTGLAYFVENEPYKKHVLNHATQKDISTCNGFKTMAHAETKNTSGLRCTGVGMAVCARHEMVRPNGIGDLQKGERYCNMDFIILSALFPCLLLWILISYDIACQWKINFSDRMLGLPELHLPATCTVDFGIPKCHVPGHKTECQTPHSLNLKKGVARTDGEGIERNWPEVNAIASSTKEMGPGSRHDTLDDHLGHHNWRKTVGLGPLLKTRQVVAEAELARQKEAHQEFTASIPDALEKEWTAMIEAWEDDKDKPNPYVSVKTYLTEDDIKHELAEEELKSAKAGVPPLHETSACGFLSLALMIEDTQRRINMDAQREEVTTHLANEIAQRRIVLQRHLNHFRELQAIYMPGTASILAMESAAADRQPEHVRLWLPSEMDPQMRRRGCFEGLIEMEDKFRKAQCNDALDSIRTLQRSCGSLYRFRNLNLRGQKANTRFQTTVNRLKAKSTISTLKYRAARAALLALRGPGLWEIEFKPLLDRDLRGPKGNEFDVDAAPDGTRIIPRTPITQTTLAKAAEGHVGEGTKLTSWIWRTSGLGDEEDDESFNEALRVEWAKGRARYMRWSEEVELLAEEQRRVLHTLKWKADWWKQRADGWVPLKPDMAEGVGAYAHRQARIQLDIHVYFSKLWTRAPSTVAVQSNAPSSTVVRGDVRGSADAEEEDVIDEAERVLSEEAHNNDDDE